MKTIEILEDFEGYPSGSRRAFKKGETVEVADAFADLVVEKGHARPAGKPAAKGKDKD